MLARFSRMLRAWMGYFISMGEDPEVMLEDAIEEMRTTMPRLNSVLVATRATVIRLEEERNQLARQDRNLDRRDPGRPSRWLTGRPQHRRRGCAAAAADPHGSAEHRRTAHRREDRARRRQDVGRLAENAAEDQDRDDSESAQGTSEEPGLKSAADAIVELQSYGVAATADKYPRQDQAGSRRIQGGGRNRHRLARHQRHRTGTHVAPAESRRASWQQFEAEMGISKPVSAPQLGSGAERRHPRRREAGSLIAPMASPDDDRSEARSILKDWSLNQYQAIVLGGTALASAGDAQSAAASRLAGQRARAAADPRFADRSAAWSTGAAWRGRGGTAPDGRRVIASLNPAHKQRFGEMDHLCRLIEANYQSLHGISQVYLSEQRGKLDMILDGCAQRMLALERYETLLRERQPGTRSRAPSPASRKSSRTRTWRSGPAAALEKNLELKRRLFKSLQEADDTIQALETELDSMALAARGAASELHLDGRSPGDVPGARHHRPAVRRLGARRPRDGGAAALRYVRLEWHGAAGGARTPAPPRPASASSPPVIADQRTQSEKPVSAFEHYPQWARDARARHPGAAGQHLRAPRQHPRSGAGAEATAAVRRSQPTSCR